MEEETGKGMVVSLIEKAVDSTEREVEPRILKAIKFSVRNSDTELRHAARTLMALMKRNHSQVRYLALLIIDELFMRSKLFRTLIVDNLDRLLSLSVGMARNDPLPRPASVASLLHSKSIEFLEKWNDSFGVHYRRLRLGYNYLKNVCSIRYPEVQANAARSLQQRRERERRAAEIRMEKFESFKKDFSSIKDDIQSTIVEIDECLAMTSSKDEDMVLSPWDDEKFEGFRNSELSCIRLGSLREGEKVEENSENKVVFEAVREAFMVLMNKHLPAVQEWMSLLIRIEAEDTEFRDTALKDLIDIRNLIHSTKKKCEEAGFDLSKTEAAEEDEDIWEDGAVTAAYEKGELDHPGRSIDQDARFHQNVEIRRSRESNPLRNELLSEAPIRKWGSSLDNWGSNSDVLANQRGLDVEGHWGRVDQDATIPAERIAELNVEASVYEEEVGTEVQACRAPLRKGGVCGRRDLRICPFHGRIIPRDDEGFPIEKESSFQNQSEEASSRNVGEEKKRKLERRARVREHNESVLRDAAMASTSRSYHIGAEVGRCCSQSRKSRKQTLASMLRSKSSTPKARIAQRISKR